jgi:hypothetical protein
MVYLPAVEVISLFLYPIKKAVAAISLQKFYGLLLGTET